jgi:transmembrane protein
MLLLARLCLTCPFWIAGMNKLLFWDNGVAEMIHVGLPAPEFINAAALTTELVGSALVVANRWTWLGAGALGVFTLWATYLAHRFWDLSGVARTMEFNAFLEHLSISASFIIVTVLAFRGEQDR